MYLALVSLISSLAAIFIPTSCVPLTALAIVLLEFFHRFFSSSLHPIKAGAQSIHNTLPANAIPAQLRGSGIQLVGGKSNTSRPGQNEEISKAQSLITSGKNTGVQLVGGNSNTSRPGQDEDISKAQLLITSGRNTGFQLVGGNSNTSRPGQDEEISKSQSLITTESNTLPLLANTAESRVLQSLSTEETVMLRQLLEKLKIDQAFKPDHALLEPTVVNAKRFLSARGWNVQHAEALWRKAVEWRITYKLSEKRQTLKKLRQLGPGHDAKFDFIQKHWFVFPIGPDKNGVPGIVARVGTADPCGLWRELDNDVDEVFVTHYLDVLEQTLEIALKNDVLDKGIVEIADLREFDVSHYFSRAFNSITGFTKLAHIMDQFYVERVKIVLLIGAPTVFNAIWKMVQPLVPKETKKKLFMFAKSEQENWVHELKNHIEVDKIPQYIGGRGNNDAVLKGDLVLKGSFEKFIKDEFENFKVGLIADVQHYDADDGYNFVKTKKRMYRGSLEGLKQAVNDWQSQQVDLVVQLGDLLDGNAKRAGDSQKAMDRLLGELNRLRVPIHHVVGNHELMNFNRETLSGAFKDEPMHHRSFSPAKLNNRYRFIVLDAYETAVIGVPENDPAYQRGLKTLLDNHPRDFRTSVDWLQGIHGTQRRFVPYNGGLTGEQLKFLQNELQQAMQQDQFVLVFTHVPILPGSCSSSCLIWNYDQVSNVLDTYACSSVLGEGRRGVLACFAGHDHKGGFGLSKAGVHHVTLASPLEAINNSAHAILNVGPGGCTLQGTGAVRNKTLLAYANPTEAQEAFSKYSQGCVDDLFHACVKQGFVKTKDECNQMWLAHDGAWDALPPGWPKQYSED